MIPFLLVWRKKLFWPLSLSCDACKSHEPARLLARARGRLRRSIVKHIALLRVIRSARVACSKPHTPPTPPAAPFAFSHAVLPLRRPPCVLHLHTPVPSSRRRSPAPARSIAGSCCAEHCGEAIYG